MFYSLSRLFEEFRQKIQPTDNQLVGLIASHSHLRNNILHPLEFVKGTILTGSYKRKTLIRPLNDVDVFVILNYKNKNEAPTPQSILNKIKDKLKFNYPNSFIKQDRPCVTADFSHCSFELTPAIEIENKSFFGKIYYTYFIPNISNLNTWIEVEDPQVLGDRLTAKNQELNGMLIPLIKMMKCWKRQNNIRHLKSFQMEEIAIAKLSSIESYRKGVEKLLWEYDFLSLCDSFKIGNMTDTEFAQYCRNVIFGTDFPISY